MGEVIVTGAGGFVGSHLVDALLRQGKTVVAVDINKELPVNLAAASANPRFTYRGVDITDAAAARGLVTEDSDMIYHLASVVGVKNYCTNPLRTIDVNVIGTRNLIGEAMKHGTKFLFTSTSEVFGKNPVVPWSEDSDRVLGDPTIARWSYGTTKALCEHMINAVNKTHGLPTVILRYFNIYGPRQAPYFIIPATVHRALNGINPVVYDGGKQTRCFTFIGDAIEATLRAAESSKALGETFNIGNEKETTILDAVNMVIDVAGKSGTLKPKFVDTRELYGSSYEDLLRRAPDTSKAKRVLGWQATTPLRQGVERVVSWARPNSAWLNAALPKEIG
jgi:UDP-glucose 4-epimerase